MASQDESEVLGLKGFRNNKHYEQVRPDYPREAVEALMKKVGVLKENGEAVSSKTFRILELGAGTGKFTRVMADVLKDTNVRITASDPVKDMCDKFKEIVPDIEIKQFPADNIDAVDQSFDAVIAVACFHWFSFQKSLNEIHRVLAPGGTFGITWNLLQPKSTWLKEICDYLDPMYKRDSIIWPSLHYEELVNIVSSSNVFSKGEEYPSNFLIERKVSPEEAFQYITSLSVLVACSDEERVEFKSFFDKTVEKHLAITQEKDLTIVFATPLFWFKKIDAFC